MTLYWLMLRMMLLLSPSEDPIARHGELATAIVSVLFIEGSLYRDDPELKRSAALLVAVAFRESSLNARAVGDNGRSFCAFQVHSSSGGTPELLEDVNRCVTTGHRMLRASIRVDREHPIAFYARGPRFASEEAQRISNDRVAVAKRLALLSF